MSRNSTVVVMLNTLPKCIQKAALQFVMLVEGAEPFKKNVSNLVLEIVLGNLLAQSLD